MNENIDLTKILKNCPKGTEFWCDIVGQVKFDKIHFNEDLCETTIILLDRNNKTLHLEKTGNLNTRFPECCVLWPSKDLRDWSKFTAPWYKKERFDPKTLQTYDKVLVKVDIEGWCADIISVPISEINNIPIVIGFANYDYVIPFNDDTKHLVGTTDEAPEFYRYWED